MKSLISAYRNMLRRNRYKKRCRLYYKLYHKLFWFYAEKTNTATQAIIQTQNAVSWFLDLDKEYEDFI